MRPGLRAIRAGASRNSRRALPAAVVVSICLSTVFAQDAALESRVMIAVRAAMAPGLPFPDSDESGALPANGNTQSLWMVRPWQPGDRAIEVIANPLNEVNQLRATRAMAQIEHNIESAQRRAAAQYDRAVAEAKRTGRSQEVDGVTLSDEGAAGAKIDAESRVLIDVLFNQAAYRFEVASSVQPAPSTQAVIPGAVAVLAVPSSTYRDDRLEADRYGEAETQVFLGTVAAPAVHKRADHSFEVTAGATASQNATAVSSLVIRLRGNEVLIADLLRKTNWTALLELIK
jgi:hypothetical protein